MYACVKKLLPLPILLLAVISCSNSPVIINPLYNRLDDQIMKSFERVTDFNESQTKQFNVIADNFHYWHRTNELPLYADWLDDVQKSIRSQTPTSPEEITEWFQRTEAFTQSFRSCHPINFSNDIIRTMNDKQLELFKQKRQSKHAKFRERYVSQSREQRIQRRMDNVIKWVSRTGLQLNSEQKKLLRDTFENQISLRTQFFGLHAEWNKRLYNILDHRQDIELDARLATHLDELWHLLERAHPQEWNENRVLWQDFAHEFIGSFTNEQRAYASGWLKKMAATLRNVSNRDVAKPQFSASIGCAREPLHTATN